MSGSRLTMPAARYLERSNVVTYLEDAVRLLLVNRVERPLEFIHQYFLSVLSGDQVIYREYEYIDATSRNRYIIFIYIYIWERCPIDSCLTFFNQARIYIPLWRSASKFSGARCWLGWLFSVGIGYVQYNFFRKFICMHRDGLYFYLSDLYAVSRFLSRCRNGRLVASCWWRPGWYAFCLFH